MATIEQKQGNQLISRMDEFKSFKFYMFEKKTEDQSQFSMQITPSNLKKSHWMIFIYLNSNLNINFIILILIYFKLK